MASTIKLKNGSGAPTAGDLVQGEPALDLTNKRLYTEDSGGTVIEVGVNPTSITTGTITASGEITANGGIALGDNDKAIFGAGSDLQIYHDGTRNYIDSDTTELRLQTSELRMVNSSNTEVGLKAVEDGAVTLYYDANDKLATTSTGIDVTGTVTADGLFVDGIAEISSTTPTLRFFETDQTDEGTLLRSAGDSFQITKMLDTGAADGIRFAIDQSSGDVSLYENTGTTAKFYWDASAESLGIGTTSPASKLDVRGGNLYVDGGGISGSAQVLASFSASSGANFGQISNTGTRWSLGYGGTLSTVGTEVLSWNSSGNVGIGTSSPTRKLHISDSSSGSLRLEGTANGSFIEMASSGTTNYIGMPAAITSGSNVDMMFYVNAAERMRIDSSGNLLLGTTDGTPYASNVKGAVFYQSGAISGSVDGLPAGYFNRKTSDGTIVDFRKDGTTVGSISVTGSATAYNTSSDQRLKENIVDAPAGNIDAIQVRSFDWKADGSHQDYGMVAQELEAVAPYAVTKGETEDDMWSVDYSKLVPMLIKEIQDLKAEVAALKGA